MSQSLIYITTSGQETALHIARILVEERLVACTNILHGATSIYRWEGRICEEIESVIVAKTNSERVPALIDRVKEIHEYRCPCVVALPIAEGNQAFLEWVDTETTVLAD